MNATAPDTSAASSAQPRTSGQMRFERRLLLAVERSVHVVAEQDFEFRAVHTRHLLSLRIRASSARPRFNLDFTVPSGTFNTCAISRYSSSSRSRKITVSRNSGDSFCNALAEARSPRAPPACRRSAKSSRSFLPAWEAALQSNPSPGPAWYGGNGRSTGYGSTASARPQTNLRPLENSSGTGTPAETLPASNPGLPDPMPVNR